MIQVVEGQNAINNISRNTAYEPVVEVQDASNRPIQGASVSFVLPSIGPGGLFADGSRTLMVQTDVSEELLREASVPTTRLGSSRYEQWLRFAAKRNRDNYADQRGGWQPGLSRRRSG